MGGLLPREPHSKIGRLLADGDLQSYDTLIDSGLVLSHHIEPVATRLNWTTYWDANAVLSLDSSRGGRETRLRSA